MYITGLKKRDVSIAVRPLDAYSGMTPKGVFAAIDGSVPIIKPDGYFVFTNLPEGSYTVTAGGDGLCTRTKTYTLSGKPVVSDLFLFSNSSRTFPPGTAYILCGGEKPSERYYAAPAGGDITLAKEYMPGAGLIVLNRRDHDLEGRRLAFADTDGFSDCLRLGQRADGGCFSLIKQPAKVHKAEERLLPISMGQADENGCLFMPIWRGGNSAEAIVSNAEGQFKKHEIKRF